MECGATITTTVNLEDVFGGFAEDPMETNALTKTNVFLGMPENT